MDKGELRILLDTAIQDGVCTARVLDIVGGAYSIDSGTVSRSDFVHIYSRRLARAQRGSALHEATRKLVDFLEGFPDEELSMISVRSGDGGFELFLADTAESRILFWMSMFSR